MNSPYDDLPKTQANYAPLTPLTFIERAAYVYPNRLAVVHGDRRRTWKETYTRCRRLASALAGRGIDKNDTVAIMAPNTPPMYEAAFGVPMCGAVLNTLNTRLDAEAIAFQLRHGGAKVLLTDREFSSVVAAALALLDDKPLVVDIDDPTWPHGALLGATDYEAFLEEGDPDYAWQSPADEWDAIALGYTSGTTGDPKGVVTPPSRRAPERGQQHPKLGHAASRGLSLDAADVSLQRLVLPMDDGGAGRSECLSPPCGGEGYAGCHPRQPCDPYVRRADRLLDADQRPG